VNARLKKMLTVLDWVVTGLVLVWAFAGNPPWWQPVAVIGVAGIVLVAAPSLIWRRKPAT
jgi:hypothetical protein